jgi:hypothetical protein
MKPELLVRGDGEFRLDRGEFGQPFVHALAPALGEAQVQPGVPGFRRGE